MIRQYNHTIDEDFLHGLLSGPWSTNFSQVRERVAAESSAELNLTVAINTFYEGVSLAWAFENDRALAQLRELLSSHLSGTLDRFAVGEIRANSGYESFSRAGAGRNPATIIRYAEMLRDRQRFIRRDPHAYADALLDGLIGLVLGELAVAQQTAMTLHELLEHPRTPPTVTHYGLAHAIDAVARHDQADLDEAVNVVADGHANQATPTPGLPAGPATLAHPELSLICRVASWYGMAWPTGPATPYVITIVDDVAHQARAMV